MYMNVHLSVCNIYVYIYTYIYIYICHAYAMINMCVYIEREGERDRDREGGRYYRSLAATARSNTSECGDRTHIQTHLARSHNMWHHIESHHIR